MVQPLCKTVWRFLKQLKIELPYDPAIPLLAIYLEKTKTLILLPKVGVWLLAALKPIKRQGWWKGKFALLQRLAIVGEGGLMSKGQLPPTDNQGARAFIGRGRGLHAETAQAALTVLLRLVMRWSDQHCLGCFKYSYS